MVMERTLDLCVAMFSVLVLALPLWLACTTASSILTSVVCALPQQLARLPCVLFLSRRSVRRRLLGLRGPIMLTFVFSWTIRLLSTPISEVQLGPRLLGTTVPTFRVSSFSILWCMNASPLTVGRLSRNTEGRPTTLVPN